MHQLSTARHRPRPTRRHALRLSNIDWRTYSKLVDAFGEKRGVRLTYDCGELEIMSPLLEHDDDSWLLGGFVIALTQVWRMPIRRGGGVTLRRKLSEKGVEPDACFWIANAPKMAGRRRLDLSKDPPPDLAIEVDVTNSSMDRLAIYASLGVPEVWRLEGNELTFHILSSERVYATASLSLAFPTVAAADLLVFLDKARMAGDENEVEREFRAWAKKKKAK